MTKMAAKEMNHALYLAQLTTEKHAVGDTVHLDRDETDMLARALRHANIQYERMKMVYEAAEALCAQPMLVKGVDATWLDVAQSHVEGPKLLARLMAAVDTVRAEDGSKRPTFEPIPSYGTLMTWADFVEGVKDGLFDDDDGSGSLATAAQVSDIDISVLRVRSTPPFPWVTHVHWCGK